VTRRRARRAEPFQACSIDCSAALNRLAQSTVPATSSSSARPHRGPCLCLRVVCPELHHRNGRLRQRPGPPLLHDLSISMGKLGYRAGGPCGWCRSARYRVPVSLKRMSYGLGPFGRVERYVRSGGRIDEEV
jgi:hypothetical protein